MIRRLAEREGLRPTYRATRLDRASSLALCVLVGAFGIPLLLGLLIPTAWSYA